MDATCDCFHIHKNAVKMDPGFAFDIGGSLAKLVYVDKENSIGDTLIIKKRIFKKTDIAELIKFIKENCIDSKSQTTDVLVTGYSSFTMKKYLLEQLNVRLTILDEFKCFARSIIYLMNNIPQKEVFHPTDAVAQEEARLSAEAWAATVYVHLVAGGEDTKKATKLPDHHILSYPDKSKFPCLVIMMGSAIGFYLVTEEGKYQLVDGNHSGGRCFLGMSQLLLGTKDFNQIMDLAEKGNSHNIDTMGKDLKASTPESGENSSDEVGIYSTYPENEIVYVMGKVLECDGPYKKEDIAQSYWKNFASELVHRACTTAKIHNFKRLYFTGGLAQHPYARRTLESYLLKVLRRVDRLETDKILYGFFKNGECYGALGALLSQEQ